MAVKKWMLLGVLAFFAPVATAGAQEKKEDTKKEAVVQEKDDKQKALDKEIKAALRGYGKVFSDLNKEAAAIQKKHAGDRAAIEKEFAKLRELLEIRQAEVHEQVVAVVAKGPTSKAAHDALFQVLQSGGDKNGVAIDLVLKHHSDSRSLKRLVEMQVMRPGANSGPILSKVASADVPKELKAVATFGSVAAKTVDFKGNQAAEDAIVAEIKAAADKYGDMKMGRQTIAEAAESTIFQFTKLRIGKVAPEIAAEDIDGVKFKLSDYRGKVVFLDFWGDW